MSFLLFSSKAASKRPLFFLAALCWSVGLNAAEPAIAPAEADDEHDAWSFVPGSYQLIGRHPDSTLTYTGSAKIERIGAQLRLTRTIAGKRSQIFGVIRRADPGEAHVLAFKWGGGKGASMPMEMVCLIGTDLDNYARLTCHWGKAGNPHKQPGMEAYFAQEPWAPVEQ